MKGKSFMKIKFSRIISFMLTLMMITSMFSTAVFAADFTKLKATGGEVTLDGTNPGTVTVYWTGTGNQNIYAVEGSWSLKETESTNYLSLTAMGSEVLTFTGMNYVDVPTGKVVWTDDSFSNPGVVSNGKQLLSATYKVAADTPAGTYTVQYSSALLVGDDYENDKTAVKAEPKIVVKRSGGSGETNPAKPTIAVTGTYTYTGSEQTATVTGYNSATMNITGNKGTDAGDYTVSVTSKTGKWADGTTAAVTAAWSIGKAEHAAINKNAGAKQGAIGEIDFASESLPQGYALGTAVKTDSENILESFGIEGTKLTFKFKADAGIGKTAVITVPVSSKNYKDFNIVTNVAVSDKENQAALAINSAAEVVFGNELTLTTTGGSGEGTVTYTVTDGTGKATIVGDKLTPAKAGTVTVKAKKALILWLQLKRQHRQAIRNIHL